MCKFQLTNDKLNIFINKVIEECIQDNISFKEIIEENTYYVSDIVNYLNYIPRENQKIYTTTNINIKKILSELLGNNKLGFKYKKKNIDIIISPLIEYKNQYIQEIISNNNTIIRAFINCYYWNNNPLYNNDVRNLGYTNELQTQLMYLFKANIIDYMENNLEFNKKEINKYRNNILNTNGEVELLVLSNLYNIPIIILDNHSDVKYLYLQGKIPVNKDTINNFTNNNDSIIIKFEYDNKKNLPSKIYSIYKI